MNKKLLALPFVLLLAASCNKDTTSRYNPPSPSTATTQNSYDQNQDQPQNSAPANGQQPFNLVKIEINPQNNSGESGSATIFDVNNKAAKVIVSLSGAPAKAVQPAHIHFGSCDKLGDVQYTLTNVGNGVFETILPISLSELVSKPFAINAHKSATELGIYTACGDSIKMVKSVSTDASMGAK